MEEDLHLPRLEGALFLWLHLTCLLPALHLLSAIRRRPMQSPPASCLLSLSAVHLQDLGEILAASVQSFVYNRSCATLRKGGMYKNHPQRRRKHLCLFAAPLH